VVLVSRVVQEAGVEEASAQIQSPHSRDVDSLVTRQARVWSQICGIAETLVMVPAIECLMSRGWLAAGRVPSRLECAAENANLGFVAVALRAAAQSGRLRHEGKGSVCPSGLPIAQLIALTQALMTGQEGSCDIGFAEQLLRWHTLQERAANQPMSVAWSFLVAPALLNLCSSVPPDVTPPQFSAGALPQGRVGELVKRGFEHFGWFEPGTEWPTLSIEGRIACAFANQLRYPLSYLPMLGRIEALMFGDPTEVLSRSPGDNEVHLDRAADIRFSTDVFKGSCASALLSIVLPLFHRERARSRPAVIVDVGCGEATMLVTLFEALRSNLATFDAAQDLMLVGVENNAVARAAATATLAASGARFLVVTGDISDPDDLAATLASHGIDLSQALHINKSVIHDRALASRQRGDAGEAWPNWENGVFAMPEGELVDAGTAHEDLVEFFGRWRPYLKRHGMIALEPHALDVADPAARSGASMTTMMEALHGFSCQYLTTASLFRDAACRARLSIAAQRMIGSTLTGHDHMSCTHLTATDEPSCRN